MPQHPMPDDCAPVPLRRTAVSPRTRARRLADAEASLAILDAHVQLLRERLAAGSARDAAARVDHVPADLLLELDAAAQAAQACVEQVLDRIDPGLVHDVRAIADLMRQHAALARGDEACG